MAVIYSVAVALMYAFTVAEPVKPLKAGTVQKGTGSGSVIRPFPQRTQNVVLTVTVYHGDKIRVSKGTLILTYGDGYVETLTSRDNDFPVVRRASKEEIARREEYIDGYNPAVRGRSAEANLKYPTSEPVAVALFQIVPKEDVMMHAKVVLLNGRSIVSDVSTMQKAMKERAFVDDLYGLRNAENPKLRVQFGKTYTLQKLTFLSKEAEAILLQRLRDAAKLEEPIRTLARAQAFNRAGMASYEQYELERLRDFRVADDRLLHLLQLLSKNGFKSVRPPDYDAKKPADYLVPNLPRRGGGGSGSNNLQAPGLQQANSG